MLNGGSHLPFLYRQSQELPRWDRFYGVMPHNIKHSMMSRDVSTMLVFSTGSNCLTRIMQWQRFDYTLRALVKLRILPWYRKSTEETLWNLQYYNNPVQTASRQLK